MKQKIKLPTNRNFGLVFFVVFLIISLWPLLSQNELRYWSLTLAIIFLILGLLNSKVLMPLNIIWMKFGLFLGNLISPIVMGIIFFCVVTPTGLILRLFKKDVIKLKRNNLKTYWIKKDNTNNDMKNQF
tara:strand:+ start:611 stop:997 length:387 start_codon:yes stop_codon:yes gene_type:complete